MDFFESQDQARKKTYYLIALFVCAVMSIILMIDVLIIGLIFYHNTHFNKQEMMFFNVFNWPFVLKVNIGVLVTIFGASFYKLVSLAGGGKTVALRLGGKLVMPNTSNPNEKKVLNVVEEMAIASGMPVPSVYLLSDELGINAFAAGYGAQDAVVGVTQGCVEKLNREQLQGVIGHEFSHILNGDMRLNLRLVAILHGILFIGYIGRAILKSHSNGYRRRGHQGKSNNVLLGLGLVVIGFGGYFFGRLIKSAVSRQREFLADAASVQFTRNPQAIAQALKIIAVDSQGSLIDSAHAEEISHFFFSPPIKGFLDTLFEKDPDAFQELREKNPQWDHTKAYSMLATHPPIADRIRRIEPSWDGVYPQKTILLEPTADIPAQQDSQKQNKITKTIIPVAQVITQLTDTQINVEKSKLVLDELPQSLKTAARDPLAARTLIFTLLLSADAEQRKTQLSKIIQSTNERDAFDEIIAEVAKTTRAQRLVIIDLCMPALRAQTEKDYQQFMYICKQLVLCDKRVEIHEWCLYTLLQNFLTPSFETQKIQAKKNRYKKLTQVRTHLQTLLSLLSWSGHADLEKTEGAFKEAVKVLGIGSLKLMDQEKVSLGDFSQATKQLAQCYPLLKPTILKALVCCVEHDGQVTALELELIYTLAAIMNCPIPPIAHQLHGKIDFIHTLDVSP